MPREKLAAKTMAKKVDEIAHYFGSASSAGQMLGYSSGAQMLRHWKNKGVIPIPQCALIEDLTMGEIKAADLNPAYAALKKNAIKFSRDIHERESTAA